MRLTSFLPLALAGLLALTACSQTPLAPTPVPPPARTPAVAATTAVPTQPPQAAQTAMPVRAALPAYLDPQSPLSQQRSVYFAYDVDTLSPEALAIVRLHATYLKGQPGLHIRIEGNADERGGREYNLALGQRRAEAVVNALKLLGVNVAQVEAVSFGREKPKAVGHDEAAWAQNRRADFSYPEK